MQLPVEFQMGYPLSSKWEDQGGGDSEDPFPNLLEPLTT